jgi:hypothetical protein
MKAVLLLVGAVGIFWAGRTLGASAAPRVPREPIDAERADLPEKAPGAAPSGAGAFDAVLVRETLRQLLREELPKLAPAQAAAAAGPAEARNEPPTAEQREAIDRAETLVQTSLSSGKWTSADRDRWRDLQGRLPVAKQMELLRLLIVKSNAGALTTPGEGPPF